MIKIVQQYDTFSQKAIFCRGHKKTLYQCHDEVRINWEGRKI